jgi:transposase InsO family protein
MREHGLNARRSRKYIPATASRHGLPVCENLLNREFRAAAAGEKWVSSYRRYAITYLRTLGGWIYLTVVLDLFNRKVIGWAFSSSLETAGRLFPPCA